jgi:hypothetical protein
MTKIPRGYGIAYHCDSEFAAVFYLIPFNVVVSFWKWALTWMQIDCGMKKPFEAGIAWAIKQESDHLRGSLT